MKSLPILVCAALFAIGCGNNVVSSNPSSSTGGSTGTDTGGSGSTGTSATDGSSNTTGTSGSGGTTGANLPRPTYPSPPNGQDYGVSISHVISNYSFHGYVKPSAGQVINEVAQFNTFSLQDVRNFTDANGNPYRYLLLDFAAGWCGPCNQEAEEYGLNSDATNSAKVGQWLAKGGLYVTVLVQNYHETNAAPPAQGDVDQWLNAHQVQSSLAGDLDGTVFGSIPQTAFPANLVIDLNTMQILDAWYGLDDNKITNSWETRLNQ